ncbi:MAG TPA: hypothetical protein VN843_24180, partial [Anaerolineales bacterium]|nr:hypothetical protein [Anaerolineales bacterium]
MIIDRIGIGAVPNDGSGDSLRVGGDKINQNLESFPESLVNFMKFIPEEHRSAIRSGTSTYDIGPRWEYAFTQEQGIEIPTGCVFSTEAALVIPTCGYVRGGGIQATESFALPYGAHPSKIAAIRLRSQTACITQGFASAESYTTGEAWNRLRSCVEGVFIDCGGVADFGFLMLLCNQPEIRRCTVAFARKAGFMVRGTQNFLIEHTRADYCPDGYHFANGCAAGSVIGPWARSYPLRHPDPEAPYDDDDGSGKGRYPLAS